MESLKARTDFMAKWRSLLCKTNPTLTTTSQLRTGRSQRSNRGALAIQSGKWPQLEQSKVDDRINFANGGAANEPQCDLDV
jgi:hypothetical protein